MLVNLIKKIKYRFDVLIASKAINQQLESQGWMQTIEEDYTNEFSDSWGKVLLGINQLNFLDKNIIDLYYIKGLSEMEIYTRNSNVYSSVNSVRRHRQSAVSKLLDKVNFSNSKSKLFF